MVKIVFDVFLTHMYVSILAGLYVSWLGMRFGTMAFEWLPRGWRPIIDATRYWVVIVSSADF